MGKRTGFLESATAALRVVVAVALTAALLVPAFMAHAQNDHQGVNLSLFYPVSTNKNPEVSTNFRLALIHGRVGSVRGFDLSPCVAITHGHFGGVQLAGFYSYVGGTFRGVSITYGLNYFKSTVKAFQLGLMGNYVEGHVTGLQYSSLFNYAAEGISGIQISSFFNVTDGDARFLQLSGIANLVGGDFHGIQISPAASVAMGEVKGAQIGFANFALRPSGLQLGAFNLAQTAGGLTVGAFNWVRRHEGVAVGLVTLSEENGTVDWITYGSSHAAVNTGIRTTVNRFYSMFAVGAIDLHQQRGATGFLSWHFGRRIPISRFWGAGVDLGFVHIMPDESDDPDVLDVIHFALQPRILAELRTSRKFAVFGGVGADVVFDSYEDPKAATKGLIFAGVSAF